MDPKDFFRQAAQPAPKPKPGFLESVEETDLGDPILKALQSRKLVIETRTGARYSLAYNLISGIESADASEVIIHASQWTFRLTGRNLNRLFAELHAEERKHVREASETEALYELPEEAEAIEAIAVLDADGRRGREPLSAARPAGQARPSPEPG